MQRLRLRTLSVSAFASSAMLMACAQVHAQTYTNTFDTSASFTTGTANRTYNPPPAWAGFDFGGNAPSLHNEAVWSSQDDTGNAGGSMELSWKFNSPVDGGEAAAFIMDVQSSPAPTFSVLSFDVMVDPRTATNTIGSGSTPDIYGGYGYFQIITRDSDAYNFDNVSDVTVNGVDQHSNGYELGNPNFTTSDAGTWEQVSCLIANGGGGTRAIEFQDYSDGPGGRDIAGYETIYIDNVSLTQLPEPASISMLALGLPALLKRRRKA